MMNFAKLTPTLSWDRILAQNDREWKRRIKGADCIILFIILY